MLGFAVYFSGSKSVTCRVSTMAMTPSTSSGTTPGHISGINQGCMYTLGAEGDTFLGNFNDFWSVFIGLVSEVSEAFFPVVGIRIIVCEDLYFVCIDTPQYEQE